MGGGDYQTLMEHVLRSGCDRWRGRLVGGRDLLQSALIPVLSGRGIGEGLTSGGGDYQTVMAIHTHVPVLRSERGRGGGPWHEKLATQRSSHIHTPLSPTASQY